MNVRFYVENIQNVCVCVIEAIFWICMDSKWCMVDHDLHDIPSESTLVLPFYVPAWVSPGLLILSKPLQQVFSRVKNMLLIVVEFGGIGICLLTDYPSFGPQNHEKWMFSALKIWGMTPKNEGCGRPWIVIFILKWSSSLEIPNTKKTIGPVRNERMSPKKQPLQKENNLPTIIFHWIFVSFRGSFSKN